MFCSLVLEDLFECLFEFVTLKVGYVVLKDLAGFSIAAILFFRLLAIMDTQRISSSTVVEITLLHLFTLYLRNTINPPNLREFLHISEIHHFRIFIYLPKLFSCIAWNDLILYIRPEILLLWTLLINFMPKWLLLIELWLISDYLWIFKWLLEVIFAFFD